MTNMIPLPILQQIIFTSRHIPRRHSRPASSGLNIRKHLRSPLLPVHRSREVQRADTVLRAVFADLLDGGHELGNCEFLERKSCCYFGGPVGGFVPEEARFGREVAGVNWKR